ncbi:MAG: hypothetical protein GY777_12830 [Candidatus Brocadiaceae bacterium]|nr:hypothetical protein [Candidatus Brocadiaceae bacterium]
MAGIVGYIAPRGYSVERKSQLMAMMREEIKYTGTELFDHWNQEYYAVSRVHHGIVNPEKQPIFNKDRSLCVMFEGEVFGYHSQKELLIKKKHRFHLQENDAEYCLHLYEEYGVKAFSKLNGSFIIVLYNLKSRELLLVNDRFSSRPIFYYHNNILLAFATQLRPLLKFPELPRVLDLQAVYDFFTFKRILGDRTFYHDIKVLPPATILHFQDGKVSFNRYWEMRYNTKIDSKENYVEALASTLQKAVARRTASNHRYGLLLSAGLDSRSVLAAMDKLPETYTLGDLPNKEVQISQKIASTKGCKHIFFERDLDYYLRIVDEAVDICDGMHQYFHAHFLGFLPKIKGEVDILLHGHGLDYTFQGLYLPLKQLKFLGKSLSLPMLSNIAFDALPEKLYKEFENYPRKDSPEKLFRNINPEKFGESILHSINSTLGGYVSNKANVHDAWDYCVIHSIYKHFTFLNVTCVRAYMDERTIIFDNELFDLYLSMPPQFRLGGNVYRKALRRLSPKIASVPNPKTWLRADMPFSFGLERFFKTSKELSKNYKIFPRTQSHSSVYTDGSWPDMNQLIRHNKKLKQLIYETIHDEKCIDPELFNIKSIDDIFESHLMGSSFNDLLLSLLTFGRWYKKYGPNT